MKAPRPITASGFLALSLLAVGTTACSGPKFTSARSITQIGGFATPESVIHDPERDVYLVSNINGSPVAKDDNGFISRVSPDGRVLEAQWISGVAADVTLHAPKGMALSGDRLYVADIDVVRVFDAETGRPLAELSIPGSTFLNDVTVLPDRRILVSDSGLTLTEAGFAPTGTDALHVLDPTGAVVTMIADAQLPRPNGVVLGEGTDERWVAYFGAGRLDAYDAAGAAKRRLTLPAGALDGLVALEEGRLLVSSWDAKAVYFVDPTVEPAEIRVLAGDLPAPADIGWDARRNRILVPLFMENRVAILEVE